MKIKMKSNQLYSLIKIYSIILILFLTFLSIAVGMLLHENNKKIALQSIQNTTGRFEFLINKNQDKVAEVGVELTSTSEKIASIQDYFDLTYSEYLTKVLDINYKKDWYYYLPKTIENLYYSDSSLLSTSMTLKNFPEIYYSQKTNTMGNKVMQLPKTAVFRFSTPLLNKDTLQTLGSFHMDFEKESFDQIILNQNSPYPIQTLVFSVNDQLIYEGSNKRIDSTISKKINEQVEQNSTVELDQLSTSYYIAESLTKNNQKIVTIIPHKAIIESTIKSTISLFLLSLVFDGLLLMILFNLFKKYVDQVEDILLTVDQISVGASKNRISVHNKKAETKQLAEGINRMLDSIQNYIKDIYELEIKQKDADMRALQSQINPHFLYNTLEYIRMSAVSEGAEELADVVFQFATLLRNNISHEKVVTVENELKFCEKYIFLYQMRYPDQVAYRFKVCDDAKETLIPKFAIQPLIENYFAHGIDFTRNENAISVKAYNEKCKTKIVISDNGIGIEKEKLAQLNQSLIQTDSFKPDSVGIMNVFTRMKLFYGNQFKMEITETKGGGTTVMMEF